MLVASDTHPGKVQRSCPVLVVTVGEIDATGVSELPE
jgi:hypothetical protein